MPRYYNVVFFFFALLYCAGISAMLIVGWINPLPWSNDSAALINARTAFYANESEAVRETDPLIELAIRRQQVRIATQYCINNEGK